MMILESFELSGKKQSSLGETAGWRPEPMSDATGRAGIKWHFRKNSAHWGPLPHSEDSWRIGSIDILVNNAGTIRRVRQLRFSRSIGTR